MLTGCNIVIYSNIEGHSRINLLKIKTELFSKRVSNGFITRIANLVTIRRFIIAKILSTNASSDGGTGVTLRPLQLAKWRHLDGLRSLAQFKTGGKTLPNHA